MPAGRYWGTPPASTMVSLAAAVGAAIWILGTKEVERLATDAARETVPASRTMRASQGM